MPTTVPQDLTDLELLEELTLFRDELARFRRVLVGLVRHEALADAQEYLRYAAEVVGRATDAVWRAILVVDVEGALDKLCATDGWRHPGLVLEQPRPSLEKLLAACQRRLADASPATRPRIEEAYAKLERTHRIEDGARQRLEARRRARYKPLAPKSGGDT